MARNLRVLGLTFAAIWAMIAVAASVAWALTEFEMEMTGTSFKAEQAAGATSEFVAGGETIGCTAGVWRGMAAAGTHKEVETSDSKEGGAGLEYLKCTDKNGKAVTVKANHCGYKLAASEKLSIVANSVANGGTKAEEQECEEKGIAYEIGGKCKIKIKAGTENAGLGTVKLTAAGKGSGRTVAAEPALVKVSYFAESCPKNGNLSDGEIKGGKYTISGFTNTKFVTQTGFTVK